MFEFQRRSPLQEQKVLAIPARGKRANRAPSFAIPKTTGHAPGNQAAQGFAYSCPLSMPVPGRCPFGGLCHTCPAQVQAKLKMGQPADKYEQEADRVAKLVTCTSAPKKQRPSPRELGSPSYSQGHVWQEPLQFTKVVPASDNRETIAQPIIQDGVSSLGMPLDPSLRTFMESRFGHDFSSVRVHSGAKAAQSAQSLQARAYTVGQDIVFATGHYRPDTKVGGLLLAHELTHVVQQEQSASAAVQREEAPPEEVVCDNDVLERARLEARARVWRVHLMLGHISTDNTRANALQVARNIIAPEITLDRLQYVIWRMWQALNSANSLRCGPEIPQCARGLEWTAYTTVGQNDIHTCNSFFNLEFPQQVTRLIHESAHAAGVGQLEGEAYLMSFDCVATERDQNVADAWAHYVHCVLGFPPEEVPEEDTMRVPRMPFWEQFTRVAPEGGGPFWEQFTER